MNIFLFSILLCIIVTIIMCLIIISLNNLFNNLCINFFGIIVMISLGICSLVCPKLMFDEYAVYTNKDVINTYKLIENNYIFKTQDENTITICYLDENDKVKTYNIYNDKIIYYNKEPKIEFVTAKYKFLYGTKAIVYLNKE